VAELSALVLGIDPGPSKSGWALLDFSIASAPVWFGGGIGENIGVILHTIGCQIGAPIDLVCVERPKALHNPMANVPVIETAWAGGFIAGHVDARGWRVQEVGPHQWRVALVGQPRAGEDVDHKVAAFLKRFVRQFPGRSNVHMRDAAGVACVGYQMSRQGMGGIGGSHA